MFSNSLPSTVSNPHQTTCPREGRGGKKKNSATVLCYGLHPVPTHGPQPPTQKKEIINNLKPQFNRSTLLLPPVLIQPRINSIARRYTHAHAPLSPKEKKKKKEAFRKPAAAALKATQVKFACIKT